MICGAIGVLGGCLLLGLAGMGLAIDAKGSVAPFIALLCFPAVFIIFIVSGVVFLRDYIVSRKEAGITK